MYLDERNDVYILIGLPHAVKNADDFYITVFKILLSLVGDVKDVCCFLLFRDFPGSLKLLIVLTAAVMFFWETLV